MTAPQAAADAPEPWARLRVDHGSGVPMWVQLKTQLEYVIATGAVPTGTRLPSVRALSGQLGVAVDTIRQAYDELGKTGLVATQRGAGTFTTLPESAGSDAARPDMTWARADTAVADLIRTGEPPHEAARAMAQRLALLQRGIDVVFVGVAASSARYASLISAQAATDFGPVRPVVLEELRSRPHSPALDAATYAISLAFHAREVERLLADRAVRVLTLMSRLEEGLLTVLPHHDGRPPVMVARPETRPIYADLLTAQRPDLADLPFASDSDPEAVAAALQHTSVVLHTSAAAGLVRSLAQPGHTLVELTHVPHEKSLHQLIQILRTDRELMLDLQRLHIASS
ncbi:GntR family transcriptional regulator [Jiangella alkaliphila]|uniref:DNA-binding transcriptional regulator YhcF, GntR family n=1 Tax=Jiangella alkaliphila TaxID=419479 RepID=A0A1H2J722_9ACTN|nr:GntR family transcriptional regulator [Jiangella alkaliphila]SDU51981.1 DNA-binding transcriptional regulator YhcF, GntR family [Jiangella alkaliphila]